MEEKRHWLRDAGYTLCWEAGLWPEDDQVFWWEKRISRAERTARRDHKDGRIKAGDRYLETIIRVIMDETGESSHERNCWRLS